MARSPWQSTRRRLAHPGEFRRTTPLWMLIGSAVWERGGRCGRYVMFPPRAYAVKDLGSLPGPSPIRQDRSAFAKSWCRCTGSTTRRSTKPLRKRHMPNAVPRGRRSAGLGAMATSASNPVADATSPRERMTPRLLNMRQAAEYLGCSFWTARDYILQGLIPVVDLPPLRPREGDRRRKNLRRVLVDRTDLDAFIESRKRRDGTAIT